MMSEKPDADVTVSKADIVEAKLEGREQALDKMSEDLAKSLLQAEKVMEHTIKGLVSLEQRAAVVKELTNMFQTPGKPSKRQIGKAFDRILEATPTYGEVATGLQRIIDLFNAHHAAETVIRNFLYTHALQANLRVRALRIVLSGRLGAPITDEELKTATDKIIEDDGKRAKEKMEKTQTDSFEESLKEAQIDAAVSLAAESEGMAVAEEAPSEPEEAAV